MGRRQSDLICSGWGWSKRSRINVWLENIWEKNIHYIYSFPLFSPYPPPQPHLGDGWLGIFPLRDLERTNQKVAQARLPSFCFFKSLWSNWKRQQRKQQRKGTSCFFKGKWKAISLGEGKKVSWLKRRSNTWASGFGRTTCTYPSFWRKTTRKIRFF